MKLESFLIQAKSLGVFGGLLAIVFYVLSLAVLISQLMWYYDHPILYWVYVVLHLVIFIIGLYFIISANGMAVLFLAVLVALLLGLMPYDLILPEVARELSAPTSSAESSNSNLMLDLFFRPAVHLVILLLARVVLIRFMKP